MSEDHKPTLKQEDFVALLRQYTPSERLERPRDMVREQYRILTNQPLPELNSKFARAYAVRDEQAPELSLYALVFDSNIPLRQKNIAALKDFRHPNMVALLADGIAEIGILSESRYVIILEKPAGQQLSVLLSQGRNPVSENILVNFMLRPLVEILIEFGRLGISHNRINLSNVYLGKNTVILGECISEPSGYSQDPLFEPIDRVITSPLAKADFSLASDCYAVAVLMLHLILGFKPFDKISKDALVESVLTKGSYQTLAMQWDLSDSMHDLFRGLLNEMRRERWDPESISSWISGRLFNLITPSSPVEVSRSFEFMGQPYYSRRSLAHAMFKNWQEASAVLADTKLGRWIETSVHKPEAAEVVLRLAASYNPDTVRFERANNDLIARTIIVLDPGGPIRFKNLAVTIEGISVLLAYSLLTHQQDDVQTIIQIFESDLLAFWLEQQKSGPDYSALMWKLQKIRSYIKMNALGFGPERCIYDLHPGLPCQSPFVKRYYANHLSEVLYALNIVAPQRSANDDFVDRHTAGFIASKLDIGKELRIHELDVIPNLATNPKLIGLKLLMRAQTKTDMDDLTGLGFWIAIRLFSLFDTIHRASQRRQIYNNLRDVAVSGTINDIGELFLKPEVFVADYTGFNSAVAEYKMRKAHIADLKSNNSLIRQSRMAGRGIAQTLAYSLCLATVYFTLKSYFHF